MAASILKCPLTMTLQKNAYFVWFWKQLCTKADWMLFIEITPSNRFHNIYSSQYWLDKEKRIFQRNRSILHVPLMKIVLTAVSSTVNKNIVMFMLIANNWGTMSWLKTDCQKRAIHTKETWISPFLNSSKEIKCQTRPSGDGKSSLIDQWKNQYLNCNQQESYSLK